MKAFLTVLFSLIVLQLSLAQYASESVDLLGHIQIDSLPNHNLGVFNDIWGYAADGKEYAIFGSAAFIHIYDVTDPALIKEVVSIESDYNSTWRDFKTYESYAYAVADNGLEGLLVIDLSELPDTAMVVFQDTKHFDICHNIFIDEDQGKLYTAGAAKLDGPTGGVHVFDLQENPTEPMFMEHYTMSNRYVHDIYVRDQIAYTSCAMSGFYIYDVSDISNEVLLANMETNGYNHSSWLSEDGSFAIFAEESPFGLPLGVADLCDLENGNIQVDNFFKFPLIEGLPDVHNLVTAHNPFIKGDFAYVSYYRDGLQIFDISDPRDVKKAGYFDAFFQNDDYLGSLDGTWGCYPFLPSGNILISDIDNGIFVLDFLLDNDGGAPEGSLCPNLIATEEISNRSISIFPNPSNGIINLESSSSKFSEWGITSLSGQEINQGSVQNGSSLLDLSFLESGIYFLSIKNPEFQIHKKLVIQK